MTDAWTYNSQPPRPDWGIRTPALKSIATRQPIRTAPAPTEATLRLASARSAVLAQVGDRVMTGQPLGPGPNSVPIHAPITGRVLAIGMRPVPAPTPTEAPCIVIGQEGAEEFFVAGPPVDPLSLAPAEVCRRVGAAGIVGLGGALFPTAVKLDPHCPIEALIINGAECEPWITCDEMLLRERAEAVIDGTRIMMHALEARHAVIAVETNMPEARVAVHDALRAAADPRIGLAVVTAKYPAGGERQLIELITGKEVPSGGLPRDIGYVCHNVGTAAAIADCFRGSRPLISRIITVTGGGIMQPGNFETRLGTPIRELIACAGGYRNEPRRLLMGGPMMGYALPGDDLPVTPATNCVVAALAAEIAPQRPEMPCIRCGECIQVCPAQLLPQEILSAALHQDSARLREFGLADCIECGCCDYVCPSSIPLTARFVVAKAMERDRGGGT